MWEVLVNDLNSSNGILKQNDPSNESVRLKDRGVEARPGTLFESGKRFTNSEYRRRT